MPDEWASVPNLCPISVAGTLPNEPAKHIHVASETIWRFSMQVFASSISTINELRQHLARRRREIGITQRDFDDLIGVTSGYASKLECGVRGFGDVSLPAYLSALGLRLALVEADEPLPRCVRTFLGQD